MKKEIDIKNTMQPHSVAKVEFYTEYLKRYLNILNLAPSIKHINIYDIFCGTGIYEDGKKGSPIAAFEVIKELYSWQVKKKEINLIINDDKEQKVNNVKTYIESQNKGICNFICYNRDAFEMFDIVLKEINNSKSDTANLVFIDPYGYKEIKKEILNGLMDKGNTEIILFLPISHMHRFTKTAIQNENNAYDPLRTFVNSFFELNHPIRSERTTAKEYIEYVKKALKFGKFFTTSYFIERNASNYFAVFFITSHIYGYEKILEVKWGLDSENGKGFIQQKPQTNLFEDIQKKENEINNYNTLENILREELKAPKNNKQLYEVVLKNEFLPKQATEIFRNWQKNNPNFEIIDLHTQEKARCNSFYVNWQNYKNQPKAIFKFKHIT